MFSSTGMKGVATIRLWDSKGNLKHTQTVTNLITTAGDLYYASRAAVGVLPAAPGDVTKVTGMKLGTGTTLPTKSGAGAALITYKTASNLPFISTFPQVGATGPDIGYKITYYVSWGPGVATDGALAEAVMVTDSAADATSVAADTIARITFTPINKQAGDTLDISWAHNFLGS